MNGRHFILLGIIACAGLISVKEGQEQVDLCYRIAAVEKNLRTVHSEIDLCKIEYQALQSPRAVAARAIELKLKVCPVAAPTPAGALSATGAGSTLTQDTHFPTDPPRSLGNAQGALKPPPTMSRTVKAH